MNWKSRIAKVISVFFYGYGGAIAPIGGFIASTDPVQFTLYNLVIWPCIGGVTLVIPQLGKMFAEISNELKKGN